MDSHTSLAAVARPDLDSALLLNLLAGAQRQKRACQRQFYTHHYSYALSVLRYLHDRDMALEAINDGFMKSFQELPRFDPTRYPDVSGWMRRILVRTAIDQFRASARHAFRADLETVTPYYADESHTPLDALSFEELLQVVGQLTPAYRAVFNVFVMDG